MSYQVSVRNLYNPHFSNPFGQVNFNLSPTSTKNANIMGSKRNSIDKSMFIQDNQISTNNKTSSNKNTIQAFLDQASILDKLEIKGKQSVMNQSFRHSALGDVGMKISHLETNNNTSNNNKLQINTDNNQYQTIEQNLAQNRYRGSSIGDYSKKIQIAQKQLVLNDNFSTQLQNNIGTSIQNVKINNNNQQGLSPSKIDYKNNMIRHQRNRSLYDSTMNHSLQLMEKIVMSKEKEQLQRTLAINGTQALQNFDKIMSSTIGSTTNRIQLNQTIDMIGNSNNIQLDTNRNESSLNNSPRLNVISGQEIILDAHKKYSDMSKHYKSIKDSRVAQNGKLSFLRPNIR